MQSCDTLALGKDFYVGNKPFFGKNSDRPLGECQPLLYVPAANHAPDEMLRCTHLTIPQVSHTHAIIGSRPYWIWGFEMGLNDQGLIIGNEAQGSRCDPETVEGLLGMDMLRLALERCATAREAIDCIGVLLETYGQNANASALYDRRYENSFLAVDKEEIWLMETAGRQWVAKRITDWSAISNCYSIGTDYDLCSEDLESYARQRRWLANSETLDFAKAYTAAGERQPRAVPRWRRMCKLIREHEGALGAEAVKQILRDHFEGEINEPRLGATFGTFMSVCMHAMCWDSFQTAASMLWEWNEKLGPIVRYAPSIPCLSVYLPLYFTDYLPEMLTTGGEKFDEKSLWWLFERLAMAVSIDEDRFGANVRAQLRALEAALARQAEAAEAVGDKNALNTLMDQAVEQAAGLARNLWEQIRAEVIAEGGLYGPRKEFLESYCKRTDLPLI